MVVKTIELLDLPVLKTIKEGVAKEKAFQVFSDWSTETTRSKGVGIKATNSQNAKLEEEIHKQKGDAEAPFPKLEELAGGIATGEEDLADATTISKMEASDLQCSARSARWGLQAQ